VPKTTKTNNKLTVYVNVDGRGEYKTITCWLMTTTDGEHLCGHHNPEGLGEVSLYGQTDLRRLADPSNTPEIIMYACGLNFAAGTSVGLGEYELRKGLKIVAKLNARLKRLEEQCGRPASFGARVQRFATVTGAATITMERSRESKQLSGCQNRTVEASSGAWMVDEVITKWTDAARPALSQSNGPAVA